MKLTLKEKKQETSDVTSFIFEAPEGFAWTAGQLLHYTLPHESPDDRGTERYFTISSAPFEKHVMVTTRFAEKGSTFKKALSALPIGAQVDADGLEGDFVAGNDTGDYVFIAGGIGITPIRSILADLDHRGPSIRAKLLYANRTNDFVFKDELEALAHKHPHFSIAYFVSPARIDEAAIRQNVPELEKSVFYVSGPEPMVQAFEKMLVGMGVPSEQVKRDEFPGYPAH